MNTDMKRLNTELTKFYRKTEIPKHLTDSIVYSLGAGGKRIRPLLFLKMLESFGITLETYHYQVAATVEMIHAGSLIHDDLPAMDDDDYRRGQLTNHKKFDEATAILAGDSLFLDPYYILATANLPAPTIVALVKELSYASGSLGMVAGQILDMDGEGKNLSLEQVKEIHTLKTGRMLTFPFVAAGIIAEKSEKVITTLRKIGQNLGLAFQIRDDIIDVTGTFEEIGKTPGKDILEEKSTYVALLGLEGAQEALDKLLNSVKYELAQITSSVEIIEIIESLEIK
ncbi:polyprenyl synthetase family protein [Lactococcus garvieae]|uniref:Farnesyl diphosphate synthase n=1 Tax=Lactococcus garvieae DCC43 TaxID=1231377 RepID=K2PN41_9LACT|nr:farnesyl diphosphate synthase [Lactococcus garvieae]EKF51629.1 Octaprenyl-diphosphate synthase/Dimethylallyltransferase/Geranyltranstransferase/Geranylgeranyl pyrophosphate synthetase [Lactococcus garvieae DCC43]